MKYIIETQYFGCVTFYAAAIAGKDLVLEQYETYQKMGFRNRCQLLGAGQVLNLSVPLIGGRDQKRLIREIEVDYSKAWQVLQWRTLESCYNKSPFFFYYKDQLRDLLFERHLTLWDLNLSTIRWASARLKLNTNIHVSSSYQKTVSEDTADLRNRFKPSNRRAFHLFPYQQVFDRPFEPNLSILDLLFNLGPAATAYLTKQPDIPPLFG